MRPFISIISASMALSLLLGNGGVVQASGSASIERVGSAHTPPAARHLYVALSGYIYRYRLIEGVPANQPDLVYEGVGGGSFGSTMAFGQEGDLYTADATGIARYRPGRRAPSSKLIVEYRNELAPVWTVAVDTNGYTYVAYLQSVGFQTFRGILAYRPFARGRATPLYNIPLALNGSYIGLAFDSKGSLYVSQQGTGSIYVYANPETSPMLVRTITTTTLPFYPEGIVIDAADELYAIDNPGSQTSIVAFHDSVSGNSVPDRVLTLSNSNLILVGGLTVIGKHLFSTSFANAGNSAVCELNKTQSGPQVPQLLVPPSEPYDVKVGP